jgi:hypothetical protein
MPPVRKPSLQAATLWRLRKGGIAQVLIALVWVTAVWADADRPGPGADRVVVRPVETQQVLANPGMGIQTFQRYNGDALNEEMQWSEEGPVNVLSAAPHQPDFPPSTVAYCRWFWNVIEPKPGEFHWEIIDLALREARRHRQRLAVRIMPYDQKHPLPEWYQQSGARRANDNSPKDKSTWEPDFADPLYYRYWGRVVLEAGKRYDGHPDLDSVDISTVGYWGEGWSNYMPEFGVQRKLIDIYFTAFRKTPLLMNFDQPEALSYGTSRGAGWRLDCLGHMQKGWSHMLDFYPQQIARAGIQDVWRTAPVSFETCWVPEKWFQNGWDVHYILSEALRWHISTLNVKSSAIPAAWKTEFDDFERKMGYRFALRRAEWSAQVSPGQSIGLLTWWVNEGVAPIYRPFVLAFRFHSPQTTAVVRTDADVRKWLPGDAVFDGPLFVPPDLQPGDYEIGVAMLDPNNLKPGIRLPIQGRGEDGWYTLGHILVRKPEADKTH